MKGASRFDREANQREFYTRFGFRPDAPSAWEPKVRSHDLRDNRDPQTVSDCILHVQRTERKTILEAASIVAGDPYRNGLGAPLKVAEAA